MSKKENRFDEIKGRVFSEAAEIFSNIWMPRLFTELATGNSPPEELLALVLEVLLWEELRSGRIELKKQERIQGPEVTAKYYQPDFVLHQLKTAAKVIIECDGYNFHRKSSDQFTTEMKRERELQKSGYRLYRFSAEELFEDPWAAGLDVLEIINGKFWAEFDGISLPYDAKKLSRLLKESNHCNEPSQTCVKLESPLTKDIEARIQALPLKRESGSLQEKIVEMRKSYPRAYEPWSKDEDQWLVDIYEKTQDLSDLSSIFLRQKSSIRSRLKKLSSNK